MLKSSKGQLQMQETIIVIFIFLVIVGLGMIFFYKFQAGSIQQDRMNYELQRFDTLLLSVPSLAEIECSSYGVAEDCVDVLKLVAFSRLSEDYQEQLGFKNITVRQVYPSVNSNECTLNRVEDCGVWNVYHSEPNVKTGSLIRKTPVSLYDPRSGEYSIGVLVVEGYDV